MLPSIEFHLSRFADKAWSEVVRPWLVEDRGKLTRSLVVVPTRGQAHLWKQRCLEEGVPLLGVEFISPGLARKKWLMASGETTPALGRELLLMGLRQLIAHRLEREEPNQGLWGFWKSLQSDPERALDDFDEMLQAGLTVADFPRRALAELFADLMKWAADLGATMAQVQSRAAARQKIESEDERIAGRVLVLGLTAESWGEFFNVAALVRRMTDICVVLPAPEFRGRAALDEKWIEVWQSVLGVEPLMVDEKEPEFTCGSVGELWTREGGHADRARVLVGLTRQDEMALVANEVGKLLKGGAELIGIIFPGADAAHVHLCRLLECMGLPFIDQVGMAGSPPIEVLLQREILNFYGRGGRLDELLQVWPMMRTLGLVELTQQVARDVCQGLFEDRQTHDLAGVIENLKARAEHRPEWKEVLRVAEILLPVWPERLSLADGLTRFEGVLQALDLEPVTGWTALTAFAKKSDELFDRAVLIEVMSSFLPGKSPPINAPGKSGFARVVITTRHRAEGTAWSHLFFVESNSGVWPRRRESSCWLDDSARALLNETSPYSLGVFTAEDRALMEKQSYAMLVRDTREEVVFSSARFGDEDTEVALGPNSWLERVLWAQGHGENAGGMEQAFVEMARTTTIGKEQEAPLDWREIWATRRDPSKPFDDWFLSGDPDQTRPEKLAARAIEAGVKDPAELWFTQVLGVERVDYEPFARALPLARGRWVHRFLARALKPAVIVSEGLGEMPSQEDATQKMADDLRHWQKQYPDNYYWKSFCEEVAAMSQGMLEQVYAMETGKYVATELNLPTAGKLNLGEPGLVITGRMDLVITDQPMWKGATVDVIDFKTGGDDRLSAKKMGADGSSLQLGVYLECLRSLGVSAGRVWMHKQPAHNSASLEMEELPLALESLDRIRGMLETGRYGALTKEQSDYAHGRFVWPLACTPIPSAILKQKHEATLAEFTTKEVGDE